MKKILIFFMFLAVAVSVSAKFRCGPTVGANFDHYHWKQKLVSSDQLVGFDAGLQCELMIPGIGFGVDFGLRYLYRGGKVGFGDQYVWSSDGIGNTDLRMHTIQVPANLRFKYTRLNGIENIIAPFVYGGPRFNFNCANSKCDAIDRYNFSLGLGCGLGVELYKKFQISAGYDWDVTDVVETHKLDDFSARLRGWVIDFAVLF